MKNKDRREQSRDVTHRKAQVNEHALRILAQL